jgi:hypothetical protein
MAELVILPALCVASESTAVRLVGLLEPVGIPALLVGMMRVGGLAERLLYLVLRRVLL